MAPQDMDIIDARNLKVGDIILDGQRKPYTETTVTKITKPSDPMKRIVELSKPGTAAQVFERTYKIDDYVAIAPRVESSIGVGA